MISVRSHHNAVLLCSPVLALLMEDVWAHDLPSCLSGNLSISFLGSRVLTFDLIKTHVIKDDSMRASPSLANVYPSRFQLRYTSWGKKLKEEGCLEDYRLGSFDTHMILLFELQYLLKDDLIQRMKSRMSESSTGEVFSYNANLFFCQAPQYSSQSSYLKNTWAESSLSYCNFVKNAYTSRHVVVTNCPSHGKKIWLFGDKRSFHYFKDGAMGPYCCSKNVEAYYQEMFVTKVAHPVGLFGRCYDFNICFDWSAIFSSCLKGSMPCPRSSLVSYDICKEHNDSVAEEFGGGS